MCRTRATRDLSILLLATSIGSAATTAEAGALYDAEAGILFTVTRVEGDNVNVFGDASEILRDQATTGTASAGTESLALVDGMPAPDPVPVAAGTMIELGSRSFGNVSSGRGPIFAISTNAVVGGYTIENLGTSNATVSFDLEYSITAIANADSPTEFAVAFSNVILFSLADEVPSLFEEIEAFTDSGGGTESGSGLVSFDVVVAAGNSEFVSASIFTDGSLQVPIPEPSTWVLLGSFSALGVRFRSRRGALLMPWPTHRGRSGS